MSESEHRRPVVVQQATKSGDIYIAIGSEIALVSLDEARDIKHRLEELVA